jgi:hypothetical protein
MEWKFLLFSLDQTNDKTFRYITVAESTSSIIDNRYFIWSYTAITIKLQNLFLNIAMY